MDTNLNIAACIEHTNSFGATIVHNICNGTMQVVPWGGLDWAVCIGAIAIILPIISAIWIVR